MLQDLWWAFTGRLDGVLCKLRGHDVEWQAQRDEICPDGDIVCHTCEITHWCRAHDPWYEPPATEADSETPVPSGDEAV